MGGKSGWRPIYEGARSSYAVNEGVYVVGKGVNVETASAIALLILRDLERGYTYDHYGNRIPMTKELARKRLVYLIALAKKHTGSNAVANKVRELVNYVLKHWRLPDWAMRLAVQRIKGIEKLKIPIPVEVKARRRRISVAA